MHWTHLYLANKNIFNERLKDSSLHVGSRRSADSKFQVVGPAKGAGSYLAGMAVAIPILNVDGRRHTNNFSKNI